MTNVTLQPSAWPRPKGYANGMAARGRLVFTAGQVGWDVQGRFPLNLTEQVESTLQNIVEVLAEADAKPEHVVRLTWYVTSRQEYLDQVKDIGVAYRRVMGKNFPAMAVVEVSGLMESDAKVEIEATAVVPD
ncbi:MAG: RidA family protein [Pseudomonadota bacterium]